MLYTATVWKNGEAPAINADNLNKLEQAVVLASQPVSYNDVLNKPALLAIGATATTAAAGNHTHNFATESVGGFMTGGDKAKLNAIAASATANDADVNLKNRANHTGTQAIATITGIVPIAQIPTGATATTVALGNHAHTATQITATAVAGGTATNVQAILVELAARIAALEAPAA